MGRTIVAFGELLWDIFPTGEVLGGAPSNFAYRAHTLGHRAVVVTRLGNDERGRRAAEQIQRLGLPLDFVQWDDEHPTGTVPITLGADGSPDFTITPNVAFDHIEMTAQLQAHAARASCICFGTLIQRSETSRKTLYELLDAAPHALKVLDINLRKECFTRETIAVSLDRADILKLNETEAQALSSIFNLSAMDFAKAAVARWDLDACVITLGDKGAIAANRAGDEVRVPGKPIRVVDTCGSGDAFTAGFVHCFLEGGSLQESCRFGNELGAAVAQTRGGTAAVDLPKTEVV